MIDKRVDNPRLFAPRPHLPRCLVWSGYAVLIWSLVYMVPHLYWALGGTIGLSMLKPSVSEIPQWKLINYIASVFLAAAGVLGISFIYLEKRRFLSWLLLAICLIGCSLSTSHGIYGMINRILQIIGVAGLESGPFNVNEHAYVLWDLMLFEPWFTIEGVLLGILGWCYLDTPRHKRIWLVLCTIGILVGLVTALFGVRFG
ncbi:MAG TPA: DUF3995 domain-containing protein [Anaerolineales bacterium]|nr:DUF3995 domain-containing protein [Anaerolineales bacterium]